MYKRVLERYWLQQGLLRNQHKISRDNRKRLLIYATKKIDVNKRAKARSNKKEKEKQVNYILNSM